MALPVTHLFLLSAHPLLLKLSQSATWKNQLTHTFQIQSHAFSVRNSVIARESCSGGVVCARCSEAEHAAEGCQKQLKCAGCGGLIWPARESAPNGSRRGGCRNWGSKKGSRLLGQEGAQLLDAAVNQHLLPSSKTNSKLSSQSWFKQNQNPHKLNHLIKLSILPHILHQTRPINPLDHQGLRMLEEGKKEKSRNTHLKQAPKNLQQQESNSITPLNLPITQF